MIRSLISLDRSGVDQRAQVSVNDSRCSESVAATRSGIVRYSAESGFNTPLAGKPSVHANSIAQRVKVSQDRTFFRLSTFSTLAKRPIVSDEEVPWVVGETSPPEPDNAVQLVDHSHSHKPMKAP